MVTLLTVIHILTAVVLILSVLLQSSKGSDVAGAFGGMGSQTAFGPRGTATFLSKSTVVLASIFVITSVSLVRLGSDTVGGGDSVLSDEPAAAAPATPAPATPGAPGATVTTTPAPAPAAPGGAPQVQSVVVNPPATSAQPTSAPPQPAAPAQPPAQGQ